MFNEVLPKCKGVYREVESEGSKRKNLGLRNTYLISLLLRVRLQKRIYEASIGVKNSIVKQCYNRLPLDLMKYI
jgi:hypothetical protein